MSKARKTNKPKTAKPKTPKPKKPAQGKSAKSNKGPERLPGDPSKAEMIERMIRVDQAGEYGAIQALHEQLRDKDAAIRADIEATGKKFTDAEKQQAEFLQKIADLKEKKILTADQKSLLANQDAIKTQLAQNVADERRLQLKHDMLKLEERSAQLNAQMANYQQSQREQYGRLSFLEEEQVEQPTQSAVL